MYQLFVRVYFTIAHAVLKKHSSEGLERFFNFVSLIPYVLLIATKSGADEQELATPILSLSQGILQTDLFLVHRFFCERKAVLVQWRSDVN